MVILHQYKLALFLPHTLLLTDKVYQQDQQWALLSTPNQLNDAFRLSLNAAPWSFAGLSTAGRYLVYPLMLIAGSLPTSDAEEMCCFWWMFSSLLMSPMTL
jgi:hypothetical protein